MLGRDWLRKVKLDWWEIRAITKHKKSLKSLLAEFEDVMSDQLGTIKGFKAKLHVAKDAKPKFCKPRPVPYAMREAVEEELDRLERTGVIKQFGSSEWAAPIVCVPKKNGICSDYKVTVNSALDKEQYLLPCPEDIFAKLESFTTLDAYNQLLLDDDSQEYVTVNTHLGLYCYKRLPFDVASAPALFQRVMDTILQDIPSSMCYIDDIIVTGATGEEHLRNPRKVLEHLREHRIHVNLQKCKFRLNIWVIGLYSCY